MRFPLCLLFPRLNFKLGSCSGFTALRVWDLPPKVNCHMTQATYKRYQTYTNTYIHLQLYKDPATFPSTKLRDPPLKTQSPLDKRPEGCHQLRQYYPFPAPHLTNSLNKWLAQSRQCQKGEKQCEKQASKRKKEHSEPRIIQENNNPMKCDTFMFCSAPFRMHFQILSRMLFMVQNIDTSL